MENLFWNRRLLFIMPSVTQSIVIAFVVFAFGFVLGSQAFPRTSIQTITSFIPTTRIETKILTSVSISTTAESILRTTTQVSTRTLTSLVSRTVLTTLSRTVTTTYVSFSTLSQVQVVCFSKTQECDRLIVSQINTAARYIHVMVYSFTSDVLAEALINARNRGVEVKVLMESQQASIPGSRYQRLISAGIETRVDGNPALMHHKVVIIDGLVVITGSYNWSVAAEDNNDENLIIIKDESIAMLYEAEFQRVWGQGRTATTTTTTTMTTSTRTTTTTRQNCDPSYPDVCIPPPPPDLDCSDIPYRNFRVLPPDPHRFDGDGDGIGCET